MQRSVEKHSTLGIGPLCRKNKWEAIKRTIKLQTLNLLITKISESYHANVQTPNLKTKQDRDHSNRLHTQPSFPHFPQPFECLLPFTTNTANTFLHFCGHNVWAVRFERYVTTQHEFNQHWASDTLTPTIKYIRASILLFCGHTVQN